jgi:opacity protein-like surface antigen
MNWLRTLLTGSIAIVGFALPTWAQDYSRTGAYVGVGGQLAIEDWGDAGGFGLNPGYGGQLLLGYRSRDWIAAEFEVVYTQFEADELFGDATIEFDFVTYTLNAKVFPSYLLADGAEPARKLQPYLKLGLGGMHVDADLNVGGGGDSAEGDGFALRFGGGLDWYINEQFLVFLDGSYTAPFGDDVRDGSDAFNTFVIGIGVGYRF